MPVEFEDEVFSIPEAAKKLRISVSYTWRLIAEKKLKAVKLGGRTLITGAAIRKLLRDAWTA